MLQRLLDPDAGPVQWRTQIVCRAVECRAQQVGLLLDAIQHAIDGERQFVELVVRAFDGETL